MPPMGSRELAVYDPPPTMRADLPRYAREAQLERARAVAHDPDEYELFVSGIVGWAETHPGKRDIFFRHLVERLSRGAQGRLVGECTEHAAESDDAKR